MQPLTYPTTRAVEQLDNYHGLILADPFRWLEDDSSIERANWIGAQNALTAAYLSLTAARHEIRQRFQQLLNYSRCYDLLQRRPYLFFRESSGLQNQPVLYIQRGLGGSQESLIDPNVLTPDGSTRLSTFAPSKSGKYLAYGLSEHGMEWEEYRVRDINAGRDLPDRLQWVKASSIAWRGNGLYYSRFPTPRETTSMRSGRNENHQVWYHRIGTSQAADALVYEDPKHPLRLHFAQTTRDERFVLLTICDPGAGDTGQALWLCDARAGQWRFTPMVTSFNDELRLVDNRADKLLVVTNRDAPRRRVVLVDPAHPEPEAWEELLPEQPLPLDDVAAVGGRLFAVYRSHTAHRLRVFDESGHFENEIALPGIGMVRVFEGQRDDTDAFWAFSNFITPPTIYRYDITNRTSHVFKKPTIQFNASEYETRRVFFRSNDGTQIPMFIVHHKQISRNSLNPSLLYGYGGNGVSVGPTFDPLLIALLERGYVFAAAGLRGGGEYGDAWHSAGRRKNKHQVFDDCIAAAEWLQASGYTSRDRSALIGTSNGGLLVGAVMTQRPDLFKVALPGAGIMDMLRFQRFTLGWAWEPEYGSSDDPEMFRVLLAYSPLHNIKKGVNYPATLVTTYEDDDCVVPAHSFKFIATLQRNGGGANPYLLRTEARSGHGAVSLERAIEERSDQYAFLVANLPSTGAPIPHEDRCQEPQT